MCHSLWKTKTNNEQTNKIQIVIFISLWFNIHSKEKKTNLMIGWESCGRNWKNTDCFLINIKNSTVKPNTHVSFYCWMHKKCNRFSFHFRFCVMLLMFWLIWDYFKYVYTYQRVPSKGVRCYYFEEKQNEKLLSPFVMLFSSFINKFNGNFFICFT